MNFPAPSPHAFTALGGTPGAPTLGLHGPPLPLPLPQRHSFGIQELLGLNSQGNTERSRPSAPLSSESLFSASALLASSFSPPLSLASMTSMTSGFNPAAFSYMPWKSSLMNALSGTAHGFLNFSAPPASQPSPGAEMAKSEYKGGKATTYVL